MSPKQTLQMPYQCLEKCGNLLIAARGSSIDIFNLEEGSLLSTWECPETQTGKEGKTEGTSGHGKAVLESPATNVTLDAVSSPAKRRKLSNSGGEDSKSELKGEPESDLKRKPLSKPLEPKREDLKSELKGESKPGQKTDDPSSNGAQTEPSLNPHIPGQCGEPKKLKSPSEPGSRKERKRNNRQTDVDGGLETPAIILLAVTKAGKHVIAVTGKDKCIRVLELVEEDKSLNQLSERQMPKRPCTIAITLDDSTIVSGDKFGDVYSLPLFPSQTLATPTSVSQTPEPPKTFMPAANELTIHSLRNRKALEQQRLQTSKTPKEKSDRPLFEHTLLLGHVSLLTDLALVTLGGRDYIITADKDEHVRVTRGIPQSHIIEGYCLASKEFVSRICVPDSRPELLVCGGGDNDLYLFEWQKGKLLGRVDLLSHVVKVRMGMGLTQEGAEALKLAVSGIFHTRQDKDIIIVTVEGLPALIVFTLKGESIEYLMTCNCAGNPLAVATNFHTTGFVRNDHILVAIDTIHRLGSTTELRDEISTDKPQQEVISPLQFFSFTWLPEGQLALVQQPDMALPLFSEPEQDGKFEEIIGRMKNLLYYNFENLRKRDGEAAIDQD